MAERRTGRGGGGWSPWLGLGVVVAAVGCCAAGPLLAAGLVGAGLGGALAGLAGLAGAVVLAGVAVIAVVVLRGRQRRPWPRSAEPDEDRGRS